MLHTCTYTDIHMHTGKKAARMEEGRGVRGGGESDVERTLNPARRSFGPSRNRWES